MIASKTAKAGVALACCARAGRSWRSADGTSGVGVAWTTRTRGNLWRTTEDDDGFLRSVVEGPAEREETERGGGGADVHRAHAASEAARRANGGREEARGPGCGRCSGWGRAEEEDEEDDDNLLAWSASLDFDAFERSLEALA